MGIQLIAHASGSSVESRATDLAVVTENLQSSSPADRVFAMKQASIWLLQKSQQAQDFVDQGYLELVVECLKEPDDDTPSSSVTVDTVGPAAALLHDCAREGKKVQDHIAALGGVPLLLDLLPAPGEPRAESQATVEALATLSLIAIGSELGRREILLAAGLPALVHCLQEDQPLVVRRHAAGVVIGLATERKERQAAIIEAGGTAPLIALLGCESGEGEVEALLAALHAATALRRLCDGAAPTAHFCQAGGVGPVVTRIVEDDPEDRRMLRLPMPLAPSTVRAECKQLLGDVYVSSEPVFQEQIVAVLERHGITIDRITTTPTAPTEQPLEGKDSMERGHKVLSCRTSMVQPKIPEIKLTLKRALRPKQAKPAAVPVEPLPQQPLPPPATAAVPPQVTPRTRSGLLWRLVAVLPCGAPHSPPHVRLAEAARPGAV